MADIVHINVEDSIKNNPEALQSVLDDLIESANAGTGVAVAAAGGGSGGGSSNTGDIIVNRTTGEVTTTDTNNNTVLLQYLYRYAHIGFSTEADGSSFTNNPSSFLADSIYVGIANTNATTRPTSPAAYQWSEYVWSETAGERFIHFTMGGGNTIEFYSTTTADENDLVRYVPADHALIDFDAPIFSNVTNGADAILVNILAKEPGTIDSDPAGWEDEGRIFVNNLGDNRALVASVQIGGTTQDNDTHKGYSYTWRKNGSPTFTPTVTQRTDTGQTSRVLLVGPDDVNNSGEDIFTCVVEDI